MKTIQEIKTDIDVLVRKQGNQGALKLGDVLDDVVDIVQNVNNTLDRFKARITNVQAFQNVVPSSATEIVFAFFGEVDLTGYTKTGSIGAGIDVYKNGTKYAVVSAKIICAPANSAYFFNNYLSLTKLDFSNFDTANVISFASMFEGCIALTTLNLSSFNTAKVRGFNYMFKSCEALTSVNISNFDTSNATSFDSMFRSCIALTSLDLSSFDTSNTTSFASMFRACNSLTTIVAHDWSAAVSSADMFYNCTSLVGGNGTTYNSSHIDATYAHIDVADNPGYFTAHA